MNEVHNRLSRLMTLTGFSLSTAEYHSQGWAIVQYDMPSRNKERRISDIMSVKECLAFVNGMIVMFEALQKP